MRMQILLAVCLLVPRLLFAQSDPAEKSVPDLLATRTELMKQFGEANATDKMDQATTFAQQLRKVEEELVASYRLQIQKTNRNFGQPSLVR